VSISRGAKGANASALLARLEKLKATYGEGAGDKKLELLKPLAGRPLGSAGEVYRLHETLSFLHAYPDSKPVLDLVERMLGGFSKRSDLKRFNRALADTGIAGTDIYYAFFWVTARWLIRRFPDYLTIDWVVFDNKKKLVGLLPALLPYSEIYALEILCYAPEEWLQRLKGPGETDAAFVVRRFAAYKAGSLAQEKLYDDIDVPMRLAPGPRTPNRTVAKYAGAPVVFRQRPFSRARPNLKNEIKKPPVRVATLSPREGRRLIDMAVVGMITHARDLDAFAYGDQYGVSLVDCGEGLQFACIGQIPERRYLLEAVYGFLALQNGVPLGYLGATTLFNSAEINYNVFETYRGAEAASIFGRALAAARYLFDARTFSIDPYQLGHDNSEGLHSGAWWFYYKLGFRPEDRQVRVLVRSELGELSRHPRRRSTLSTLRKLSSQPMFFYLDRKHRDVLAKLPLGTLGLKISRLLADRFGGDREKGLRVLSREADRLLDVRSRQSWPAGERQAWERWCPLILSLPGISGWSPADKRALVQVVRAKGGRWEARFVSLFNQHRRLKNAILKLAE